MFSFYPSRRRRLGMASVACDGMKSRRRRVCHHAQACISVGLIPYATLSRFHTATSCGLHTSLRDDSKKKTSEPIGSDVFFLSKPTKEAWYGIRRLRRHGITSKTCMSSRASVYLRRLDSIHPFGMIQKRKHPNFQFGCFLFIQADEGGLVWHPSLATA